ncbi:hypothetical protein HZC21_01335 [Candidatus Peregrinibacteria bacterium]|nr:hypothetical protein [Candidatus Peregrinibacteria bacterium]
MEQGATITDESYLPDLAEALKEFAKPEDLKADNKPVYKIDEGGIKRTCFGRGNFTPSGRSEIANLLRDYEMGSDRAFSTIEAIMEGLPASIKMDKKEQPLDGGRRMVTHIILISRADIFKILKPSQQA